MITIIKDGKNTKTTTLKKFKVVCDNCGCEFELNENDFETTYVSCSLTATSLPGVPTISGNTKVYIKCPYCNKEINRYGPCCEEIGTETIEEPIRKYIKEPEENGRLVTVLTSSKSDDPCDNCAVQHLGQCWTCKYNKFKPIEPTCFLTTSDDNVAFASWSNETLDTQYTADIPDFGHEYFTINDLKGNI